MFLVAAPSASFTLPASDDGVDALRLTAVSRAGFHFLLKNAARFRCATSGHCTHVTAAMSIAAAQCRRRYFGDASFSSRPSDDCCVMLGASNRLLSRVKMMAIYQNIYAAEMAKSREWRQRCFICLLDDRAHDRNRMHKASQPYVSWRERMLGLGKAIRAYASSR